MKGLVDELNITDSRIDTNTVPELEPRQMKSSSLRSSPRQSPRGDSSHQFSIWGLPTTVIAVVASIAWMAVSSGLIMLNKSLLSGGFPYPMALSGLGMGFSGLASYITIHHFKLVQVSRSMSVDFWMRRILPIGLLMALTLAFGTSFR